MLNFGIWSAYLFGLRETSSVIIEVTQYLCNTHKAHAAGLHGLALHVLEQSRWEEEERQVWRGRAGGRRGEAAPSSSVPLQLIQRSEVESPQPRQFRCCTRWCTREVPHRQEGLQCILEEDCLCHLRYEKTIDKFDDCFATLICWQMFWTTFLAFWVLSWIVVVHHSFCVAASRFKDRLLWTTLHRSSVELHRHRTSSVSRRGFNVRLVMSSNEIFRSTLMSSMHYRSTNNWIVLLTSKLDQLTKMQDFLAA